jgi:osmotically inducible protein OsmC
MKRFLNCIFRTGKDGSDRTLVDPRALNNASYSWDMNFGEDNDPDPEELLAAAHAGCFTKKLGFILINTGYAPKEIHTDSTIVIDGTRITESRLSVRADVPGISREFFFECAEKAKRECPVSRALNMKIYVDADLATTGKIYPKNSPSIAV